MKGRKRKDESRAAELRQRLIVWQQTPESVRPALRTLARELRISHGLLQHYLNNLEKRQADEDWRRAREIRARATAEDRPMTPWEEQQSRSLDRRALRLFIESTLDDHVKKLECEIEQTIRDGNAPAPQVSKMLRMIASTPRGPAAHRGAQRASAVLQKYFSPEGQKAIRAQLRKAPKLERAVRRVPKARYHEIRLQKLVERFEETGGVLLLDEGQVGYFVPRETAVSRVLLSELAHYDERLRQRLMELVGKVDFEKIKAEICQRFPSASLSPLNPH